MNLSGTRDGVLYFDYAYGIYGIKNKTFTATVEASTDGGQTWTTNRDAKTDTVNAGGIFLQAAMPWRAALRSWFPPSMRWTASSSPSAM